MKRPRHWLRNAIAVIVLGWILLVFCRQELLKRRAVRALGVSWPLPSNESIDVPVLTFLLNPFGPDPSVVYLDINGGFEKVIVLDPNGNISPPYGNR